MLASTYRLTSPLEELPDDKLKPSADLVLVYAPPFSLEDPSLLEKLTTQYPKARVLGCSSAGECLDGKPYDNSIVYSAIQFEHTTLRPARVDLPEEKRNEFLAGQALANELAGEDLVMVLLFSEGLAVDCDELIRGIQSVLGSETAIFGGLAGDSLSFERTVVLSNEGVSADAVVAVGFYGDRLRFETVTSHFDQSGETIEITAAQGNLLSEINGRPALDVLEEFILREEGVGITESLSFPIIILDPTTHKPLYCRTIHEYNTEDGTLLAAGSFPVGPAKLINMYDKTNFLIDTRKTSGRLEKDRHQFALIISCAARRGTLGNDWMEELSLISEALGEMSSIGFYSYGEIGKSNFGNFTIVHNQTLNIAAFHEV